MRFPVVVAAAMLIGLPPAAVSAKDAPVSLDYLKLVRAYADAMINSGRDASGKQRSPLLATTLDRKTMQLMRGIPNIAGIRNHDRMVAGANPMHDQNLYQVLYALTKTTGDQRYAAEADRTLKWFFEHCQSKQTGLLAWGEHIGWDFNTETIIDKPAGTIHEYYRPWVLWERSFGLAPTSCKRFALGVWDHQIADHKTCRYSRHARYDKHGPGQGSEYPRHGGFYIATWAAAFERTQEPEFLKAIGGLVDSYEARRHKQTDALMAETISPEMMWPPSNLSLAVDLWDSAGKVPPQLAATMRRCASRTDKVFLSLKHDLRSGGNGFILTANTATLEPGWSRAGKVTSGRNFTQTWATAYGRMTDAQFAMLCRLRHQQVPRDGFQKLVLDTAARYLTSDPNPDVTLYPGALGDAIALLLATYRLTGDQKYLQRADHFGEMAAKLFLEGSPLPRASSKHHHYEAVTRADTLMMELLNLWAAKHKPQLELRLVYNDR